MISTFIANTLTKKYTSSLLSEAVIFNGCLEILIILIGPT